MYYFFFTIFFIFSFFFFKKKYRIWQCINSTIYKTFMDCILGIAWCLQTCSGNKIVYYELNDEF